MLFNGRYGYAVKGDAAEEKCDSLSSHFEHIQTDVEHYINTVNTKFIEPVVVTQSRRSKSYWRSALPDS